MKIESIEGIIISETNYSESSKILNIYTREHGLIGVMSKGCRNIKSKLREVSRRLIHGTIHIYYKEEGLSTLISIDIINSFYNTMMDLEKISYSTYILDLVNQVIRQNDDTNIFDLLKYSLIKINDGLDPLIITSILELKLLSYLGVEPNLESCCHCGSKKQIVTISSYAGGYLCINCCQNEPLVGNDTIKTIRLYHYIDIKKIKKIDINKKTVIDINRFLDDYYDRFTGIYIKSKDFIRNIRKLNQ